ncbi:MAG: serine protease [Acidobacteriota bacterium]|nr:serine protease [Acidobacteriota bacterium]
MKEIEKGKLSIIGTGFYISRYGLFLTAKHVLEELVDYQRRTILRSFICHLEDDDEDVGKVYLRTIRYISLMNEVDLAVAQANNYNEEFPQSPLANLRATLTTEVPQIGSSLVTFAYPENKILDFTQSETTPEIKADFYEGLFLKHVTNSEHPFIPYPHYETSIQIKHGASGGPVFANGRVIGVNCRGWDFGEAEDDKNSLSYIIPVRELLSAQIDLVQLPEISWEYNQIPDSQRNKALTVAELVRFGHIEFEPPIM